MLKILTYVLLEMYQTNTYLVYDQVSSEALLIDPSSPSTQLVEFIENNKLKCKAIINTHGHGDHIGGNDWFKEKLETKIAIHKHDASMLTNASRNLSTYMGKQLNLNHADILLDDNDTFCLGDHVCRIIHTPGHTKGSICIECDLMLISGDTLFEQSIGRTDLPGGNHEQIIESIKSKLFYLNDNVVVYPGHGPRTTIGLEKHTNPFIT